ncbi:transposase [Streptomyces sp. NPDC096339]|uniref:transposase n=1 Tax=Streptomyces sp. NPDC096339 TaxID=3366086 RepID=UPI00381A3755
MAVVWASTRTTVSATSTNSTDTFSIDQNSSSSSCSRTLLTGQNCRAHSSTAGRFSGDLVSRPTTSNSHAAYSPTRSGPEPEIQNRVRKEQKTTPWRERYAMRAGCEATVSETVRAHGLRHCRYRGIAKTHVQHVLVAAGANVIRLSQHRPTDRPSGQTTCFQDLCQQVRSGTQAGHS